MQSNDFYDPENLRFRRAYIRERLTRMKAEREELILERDMIDQQLQEKKRKPVEMRPEGGVMRLLTSR